MRDANASERLAATLSGLERQWDSVRTEHALAGLHQRRRHRRRRAALAAGVITAALAALAMLVVSSPEGEPVAVREGGAVAIALPTPEGSLSPRFADGSPRPTDGPRSTDRAVRFADGSLVTPDANAEVILEAVSSERIALELRAGSIAVEVTPRPERVFEIDCGLVRVTVLGTGFSVERRLDMTFVRVLHGRVRVSWDGGERVLGADEEGLFPEGLGSAATPPLEPPAARGTPRAPREVEPEASPVPLERHSAADWRPLAERGDYESAYQALAAGEVDDEVETLLLAADAARLSGHGAAALPYLARAASHEDDPRALLASFTRGRILVSLGRPSEGAAELERVIARSPTSALAEDALARAIDAHQRAGDHERARALSRRYLREHPGGRWAERAEAALDSEPR